MLIETTIFFLGLSLVFYVLFAGADFGAGVLEILTGQHNRETIADAIAPVWEANHVWLILAVVILYMAFPEIYAAMSVYLHIPLLLMLVGIVLRGTAFAFRHYDAIKDQSNAVYDAVFKISSVFTPLFTGMVVGGAALGKISPETNSFSEAFIAPWFNLFSFFVGLFTLALFTFLAAVYLIGETGNERYRQTFIRVARRLNVAAVIIGALVFAGAHLQGLPLFTLFVKSWFAMGMVLAATLLLPALWWSLYRSRVLWSRIIAAGQVVAVLLAWFWVQHPVVINLQGTTDLTFYNTAAPDATLVQLILALAIGALIILPFLFYLMKTFKGSQFSTNG